MRAIKRSEAHAVLTDSTTVVAFNQRLYAKHGHADRNAAIEKSMIKLSIGAEETMTAADDKNATAR